MNALSKIEGITEAVKSVSVEISGTIFHQKNGKTRQTSRKQPFIALDRTNLVIALLEKLTEKYDNSRLKIYFNCQCTEVDFQAKTVRIEKVMAGMPGRNVSADFSVTYDLLIGADGARSVVRKQFLDTQKFEYEQKYVRSNYKSIFLGSDKKQGVQLKPGYIHSWRLDENIILLILHQPNGTMSGAILLPQQKNKVVDLATTDEVLNFFHEQIPEVGQLMSESEAEAFLAKPISTVLTIQCSHYHYGDSVLLIGDAAHSVSPSIGQGCNAALEDVVVFDSLLDEYSDNIAKAVEQFSVERQPDAHALVELGNNTFPSSKSLFVEFIIRQRLAKILYRLFPQHFSPPLSDLIFESSVPYSQILNSYQGWISKVKKSNDKLFAAL